MGKDGAGVAGRKQTGCSGPSALLAGVNGSGLDVHVAGDGGWLVMTLVMVRLMQACLPVFGFASHHGRRMRGQVSRPRQPVYRPVQRVVGPVSGVAARVRTKVYEIGFTKSVCFFGIFMV